MGASVAKPKQKPFGFVNRDFLLGPQFEDAHARVW